MLAIAVTLVVYFGSDAGQQDTTLKVVGQSMQPMLPAGSRVRLESLADKPLAHGELVVIKFSTLPKPMLKRVLAMGGDEVRCDNGRLYINGAVLETPHWPKQRVMPLKACRLINLQLSRYDQRIPKDHIIALGDNTNNSFDSGDFGIVSMTQVVGRAVPQ